MLLQWDTVITLCEKEPPLAEAAGIKLFIMIVLNHWKEAEGSSSCNYTDHQKQQGLSSLEQHNWMSTVLASESLPSECVMWGMGCLLLLIAIPPQGFKLSFIRVKKWKQLKAQEWLIGWRLHVFLFFLPFIFQLIGSNWLCMWVQGVSIPLPKLQWVLHSKAGF